MAHLFVHEDREYLLSAGDRLETDLGVLEVPEEITAGDVVETHLGTAFRVRELRGPDLFAHLDRTGAPMMPRDIGLVVGHTGISSGDRILDAGTGTGVLAAYLGRLGASVITYERDSEFATVARENMTTAGVGDQVEVRTGDVCQDVDDLAGGGEGKGENGPDDGAAGSDTDGFDVITLDTEDAPAIVRRAPELLAAGGFLAVYSPFVEHTREVAKAAREVGLSEVETVETIQREMDFDDRGSRPSTAGVGHTGYLTFARHTG